MKRPILKVWITVGAPLLFTACANIGPPQPPSLELPKPPSDLRAARHGHRATLTWTIPGITTDRQTIRRLGPTRICRGLAAELTECAPPVGEAAPPPSLVVSKSAKQKAQNSYIDTLPVQLESDDPSTYITYAIEVLNTDGRSAGLSNQVRVPLIRTLPPPRDFSARVTREGVVLTWTGEPLPAISVQSVHYFYRIYRRPENGQQWTVAGEVPAEDGRLLTLTDSSIEWEMTYEYRAEAVTAIAQENKPAIQVEGGETPEVQVFAHDIFPPAVPSGLQAVFSGPGQKPFIDLVWAPVANIDLDGYNVYRHEAGAAPAKLNRDLVKTPAHRDADVVSGKTYFYSVSAVDVRGNESARSEEASERMP